jgi:SanA protein
MSWFKWRYFLYLLIVGLWAIWFINIRIMFNANDIAIDCDKSVDIYPVGIVLGARVIGVAQISDVYADRLQTAVNIYKKGKITKILVSGDHGQTTYDEVNAGRDYLLKEGVLASDIFLDHAGFDTYDSIYRAKKIFGVSRALIITQEFHLPRALYFAENLEIDALGCKADLHEYQDIGNMEKREILARIKAWISNACKVKPKYLGETYDITGDGQKTWDRVSY